MHLPLLIDEVVVEVMIDEVVVEVKVDVVGTTA